jgi:hypothetical protein
MPSGEEINEDKFVSAAKDERTVNNTMRHQYRVLSEAEKSQMILIKDIGAQFLGVCDGLGSKREYSIAKTKIEEAVMWAVKGLTG